MNKMKLPMKKYLRQFAYASFPRPFDVAVLGLGNELVGAEVGVFEGIHARLLVKNNSVARLYCIDPYRIYEDLKLDTNMPKAKARAIERLKFSGKVVWMFENSVEASFRIFHELDFVYIDAAHNYKNAVADIDAWWPLVKPGGIIGGHDFHHTWPGVVRAVTEFSVKKGLDLCCETPDWWVVKLK
jgi:hypothetical protein